MFGIGGPELAVILVVALIFVGPEKLPKVARSIGTGLRDLRRVANLAQAELKETVDDLIREADIEDEAYEREKADKKQQATAGAPPSPKPSAAATSAVVAGGATAAATATTSDDDLVTPAGRAPDPAEPATTAATTVGAGPQIAAVAAASSAATSVSEDAPRDFADLFVEKANAWQAESSWEDSSAAPAETDWTANEAPAPFEMDLPGVRLDGAPAGVSGTQARRGAPVRSGSPAALADVAAAERAAAETVAAATDIDSAPSDDKDGPA